MIDDSAGFYVHPVGRLSEAAVLDVGLKCVHSCRFCYYSYLDGTDDQFRGMRSAQFRTLSECREILRLLKQNGFVGFDYTGGEPTLHPDIVEITRYAHHELHLHGRMITLGQFLLKKPRDGKQDSLLDALLEAGLTNFLFSLHAVEEQLFNRITKGSYNKLEGAMNHLDELGFDYTSNTTVFEWNYKHLPAIAHRITKHSIYLHNFIIMNAYYEWNKDGRAFGIQARYSDIYPYLKEAVDILESNNVGVNIRYAPLCTVKGMERNLVGMVGVRYDPYEWMNLAGHKGGSPAHCASRIPLKEGEIESHLTYSPLSARFENGVAVTGTRGGLKHFTYNCVHCTARNVCDGIDTNYLRTNGSNEFQPYVEAENSPVQKARYGYTVPFLVKTKQYARMKQAVTEEFRKMNASQSSAQAKVTDPSISPGEAAVSVVIPCYNYARFLTDAVRSVLAQSFRDIEIIIVNDGSTDNTAETAEGLIAIHPDRRIVLINQANSGQPAISRNRGILEAKGKYILCLDADDMLAPSMIEECISILEKNPSVGIVYTDRLDFGGVNQVVKAKDYNFQTLRYANHISYCALFRRGVWEDIGGYRTNVKGCEDWDFWVAAGARGHFGYYLPKPLFIYRRHDTGIYQEVLKDYKSKFAQIILNNGEAYTQDDIKSAEGYLALVARGTGQTLETAEPCRPCDPKKRVDPAAGKSSHGPETQDAMPLVSVIVPTYNRPEMLNRALKSILAQSWRNFEVIIINDAGEDVAGIIDGNNNGNRILYVRNESNHGRSASRNMALSMARGKYIAYLDDDDVFYPDHLETLARFLESSEYSVAYSDAHRIHQDKMAGRFVETGRDVPYSFDFDARVLLQSNYIPILCVMHEKSCLEDAGLFDENLEVLEDWDLWIRLSLKYEFAHIRKVTAGFTWRTDGSSTTSSPVYRPEWVRNREIIANKYKGVRAPTFDSCLQTAQAPRQHPAPPSPARPLVSIIILAINQKNWTLGCLNSIAKHTSLPYEVILVDNGSDNDTVNTLVNFACNNPCASVIFNADNKGFAGGNNLGMAIAGGEYVLLLNNDTLVTEGWLEGLLKAFAAHPASGIVGPMSNHVVGAQIVKEAEYSNAAEMEAFAARWREAHRDETFPIHAAIGFCMLIKRKVIDTIGGLDPLFGIGNFEDIDYCYRALLAGFEIRAVKDVFIHHQGGLTFKAENVDYLRIMKKNWELFKAKWGIKPGMPLEEREISLNKEVALRQHIDLPRLEKTHERNGKGKCWYERSKDLRPGEKTKGTGATSTSSADHPVSIIIPTYQNLHLTRQCIEGILHNTSDARCEIILVDNNSTDGTREYLQEIQSKGILKAVLNPVNMGFAHACNQGAQAAEFPFLIFLNNDTFPMEGWARSLLQTALRNQNAAIIGSKLIYPDGRVQHAGMELIHFDKGRKLTHPIPGHPHRFAGSDAPEVNQYRELDMVTGACILVRKEVFFLLGGFDEVYRNGVEDVDLCLRARCAGYRIIYQPESVVIHHEGQSPGRFDKENVSQNLSIYFARWGKRFGRDGRLITPEPACIIRSQKSVLPLGGDGRPSERYPVPKRPEERGLRICSL